MQSFPMNVTELEGSAIIGRITFFIRAKFAAFEIFYSKHNKSRLIINFSFMLHVFICLKVTFLEQIRFLNGKLL